MAQPGNRKINIPRRAARPSVGDGGPYFVWRSRDRGQTWDKTQKCEPVGFKSKYGFFGGFHFDFEHDRLMLDTKTGSRFQGGGFGPTVQLQDGTLVTSCSYRGTDDKTHLEVIRWRAPDGK